MGILERIIDTSARKRFLVFIATGLALAGGIYSILHTPLDALPDLSDTQVIVFTEWMGRGPTLVEDQVTYPLVTTFLAAPKVKVVQAVRFKAAALTTSIPRLSAGSTLTPAGSLFVSPNAHARQSRCHWPFWA